jgi:hypothetical protein
MDQRSDAWENIRRTWDEIQPNCVQLVLCDRMNVAHLDISPVLFLSNNNTLLRNV